MLYLRNSTNGLLNWRLMKRAPGGAPTWTQEAAGLSTDDVTLSRDPINDLAHVTAWPNSVPTIYSSPKFEGTPIPGKWQVLGSSSRHYGNTGIGPDGTLCIKVSLETTTAATSTQYSCGKFNSTIKNWTWGPQITKTIGNRLAYDYIFPGSSGNPAQFLATAQNDLHKDAAGLRALAASEGSYVFNGVTQYLTGIADVKSWQTSEIVLPYFAPGTATTAPYVRQIDAFVDSKKRVFTSYWVDDPLKATPRGIYLVVSDSTGNIKFKAPWSVLPTYGFVRIFEDNIGRLWLLWTAQGTAITQVHLYRINEATTPTMAFSLSNKTDLSSKFAPYSILGSPQLSLQRGGQNIGNALDGVMVACDGTYITGKTLDCTPRGENRQRIIQFRVRLPN